MLYKLQTLRFCSHHFGARNGRKNVKQVFLGIVQAKSVCQL